MEDLSRKIISKLPYGAGFLFVDEITYVDEDRIVGNYTFRSDAPYYKWHFKHRPVTPGVLIIETMGQIGMVCHIVFLEKLYDSNVKFSPILLNVELSFIKEVFPNEKLEVRSRKIYYRNGVLKSRLWLKNPLNEDCALGTYQVKLLNDE